VSRTRIIAAAGLAAAALSAAAVFAAPASAAAKPTALVLTIAQGDATAAVDRTSTLYCNPTGGTHPVAVDACAALTVVRGELRMLDADPSVMCPMIYQPVTVTASGFVNGKRFNYQRTHGNACTLGAETGSLFQF